MKNPFCQRISYNSITFELYNCSCSVWFSWTFTLSTGSFPLVSHIETVAWYFIKRGGGKNYTQQLTNTSETHCINLLTKWNAIKLGIKVKKEKKNHEKVMWKNRCIVKEFRGSRKEDQWKQLLLADLSVDLKHFCLQCASECIFCEQWNIKT